MKLFSITLVFDNNFFQSLLPNPKLILLEMRPVSYFRFNKIMNKSTSIHLWLDLDNLFFYDAIQLCRTRYCLRA